MLGYTTGVYDLFHIGHLRLLQSASQLCDRLIVGVTVDELVKYKNKEAAIPFEERLAIVEGCKYVDCAIAQRSIDKFEAWEKLKFDVLFVGDDWFATESWVKTEQMLKEVNVKVMYLPYTTKTSSSLLRDYLAAV